MTSIISNATLYIPLPKGFQNTFIFRPKTTTNTTTTSDQQQQQLDQEENLLPEDTTRASSVSSSSSSSSSNLFSSGNTSSLDDISDEEDGALHLLNLGHAPPNNARNDKIDKHSPSDFETMYFCCFLLLISKPFLNTFTPIIVSDGTHEKKELEIYLLSETFVFSNSIGFGPDVPMSMCLSSTKKINRFLKSVDKRSAVEDLTEFTELLINQCPFLENVHFDMYDQSSLQEIENIFKACITIVERGRNFDLRGAGARVIAVKALHCLSHMRADVHALLVKYNVLPIVRKALLQNRFNNAIAYRDFMVCLEAFIVLENACSNRGELVPIESITPFSEFNECIEIVETIFENGDQRFLFSNDILPFLLNFFVKIVSVPRLEKENILVSLGGGSAGNNNQNANNNNNTNNNQQRPRTGPVYLHPAAKRKNDFVNRYRDTLIPHIFKLIHNIPNMTDHLNVDIIIRVICLLNELRSDVYWCDYFGENKIYSREGWKAMIRSGRQSSEHFPFEDVTAILHRIVTAREKFASGILPAITYLIAKLTRDISENKIIDFEIKQFEEVPMMLKCQLLEETAKIVLMHTYSDGVTPIEDQLKDHAVGIIRLLTDYEELRDSDDESDEDDNDDEDGKTIFLNAASKYVAFETKAVASFLQFVQDFTQPVLDRMFLTTVQLKSLYGEHFNTNPETSRDNKNVAIPGRKFINDPTIFDFVELDEEDERRQKAIVTLHSKRELLYTLKNIFSIIAEVQHNCKVDGNAVVASLLMKFPDTEKLDNFIRKAVDVLHDEENRASLDFDPDDNAGDDMLRDVLDRINNRNDDSDDSDDDDDDSDSDQQAPPPRRAAGTRRTRSGGRVVAAATTTRKPKPKPKAKKVAAKKETKPKPKAKKPAAKKKKQQVVKKKAKKQAPKPKKAKGKKAVPKRQGKKPTAKKGKK